MNLIIEKTCSLMKFYSKVIFINTFTLIILCIVRVSGIVGYITYDIKEKSFILVCVVLKLSLK